MDQLQQFYVAPEADVSTLFKCEFSLSDWGLEEDPLAETSMGDYAGGDEDWFKDFDLKSWDSWGLHSSETTGGSSPVMPNSNGEHQGAELSVVSANSSIMAVDQAPNLSHDTSPLTEMCTIAQEWQNTPPSLQEVNTGYEVTFQK